LKGNAEGNVGFDGFSYGYRDVDGSLCHKSHLKAYGESWEAEDVIGCYIVQEQLEGENQMEFYKNGISQGVAVTGFKTEKYYPAVSLYGGSTVEVNFGPDFAFRPERPDCAPNAFYFEADSEKQKRKKKPKLADDEYAGRPPKVGSPAEKREREEGAVKVAEEEEEEKRPKIEGAEEAGAVLPLVDPSPAAVVTEPTPAVPSSEKEEIGIAN
jgi:hypothetical protein